MLHLLRQHFHWSQCLGQLLCFPSTGGNTRSGPIGGASVAFVFLQQQAAKERAAAAFAGEQQACRTAVFVLAVCRKPWWTTRCAPSPTSPTSATSWCWWRGAACPAPPPRTASKPPPAPRRARSSTKWSATSLSQRMWVNGIPLFKQRGSWRELWSQRPFVGKVNLWDIKLIVQPGLYPLVQWVGTKWHIWASRHLEWGGTVLDLFYCLGRAAQGCPLPTPGSLWLLACSCMYSQTCHLILWCLGTHSAVYFALLFLHP